MQPIPIDDRKFHDLIKICKHLNQFPIFLPQYYPKTSSNPIGDLFCALVDECQEYLGAITPHELRALVRSMHPSFWSMVGDTSETPAGRDFLQRLAVFFLVDLVQKSFFDFKEAASPNLDGSDVLRAYPELREALDKDGLLRVGDGMILLPGGILYKDHVLHYHQYLRRGYASNPNYEFLGRFAAYFKQDSVSNRFAIAIDHNRLMPKDYYASMGECDVWFGPRFDLTKLDDPSSVGLTVVKRSRPSLFDLTARVGRTEFWWSFRSGIKSFEVEEVSDLDEVYGPYNLNRYVHAERDVAAHVLRHFDGAVKIYARDGYGKRHSSRMPVEPKCYRKVKLFRIDGNIDITQWIELTSYFFKGNEMVIEYFDPELFSRAFGEMIRKCQSTSPPPPGLPTE